MDSNIQFIENKSQLNVNGKLYLFIPDCTKDNQVLTWDGQNIVWSDEKKLEILTYGISWTPGLIDPKCKRIGNLELHRRLPILNGMKGCIFNCIDNKVVYWLDEDDWNFSKLTIPAEYVDARSTDNFINLKFNPTNILSDMTVARCCRIKQVKVNGYIVNVGILESGTYAGYCKFNIYDTHPNYAELKALASTPEKLIILLGSILDGYDGEVMIHIPEFWIKSWENEDENIVRISPVYIDSTWEHLKECYLSAYRNTVLRSVPENMGYLSRLPVNAAISVVNTNAYCRGGDNGASGNFDNYLTTDPFKSLLGKPSGLRCSTTYGGRLYARMECKWGYKHLITYQEYKNIFYWLYVIEYANFKHTDPYTDELTKDGFKQGGIGIGFTIYNIASNLWESIGYTPLTPCGFNNKIGNKTGYTSATVFNVNVDIPRWRGIDNLIGDSFVTVDNIILNKVNDTYFDVYITNYPSDTLSDDAEVIRTKITANYVKEYSLGTNANIISYTGTDATYNTAKCNTLRGSSSSNTEKYIIYWFGGNLNNASFRVYNNVLSSRDRDYTWFSLYTPN